jgi:glycosyltransferase involved in cell wall biosynthesis
MKISVIIACKNEVDTIEKTINSVLEQTYTDFEIIAIDGNSTDGTLDIIREYPKVTLITGEENGIYPAMNKGIENANGDILYFLNANDYLYSNDVFEKIIAVFATQKPDIIYGETIFKTEDKEVFVSHKDFYSKFVWAYRNINHQSTFYKKWLFDKYGQYDESYKILADVDFTTKCVTQNDVKAVYTNQVVAYYNHEGVSSYSNPENVKIAQREKKRISKKYLKLESALFTLYNLIFGLPNKFINKTLKNKYGLDAIYKYRDIKRSIGRSFWWLRKI